MPSGPAPVKRASARSTSSACAGVARRLSAAARVSMPSARRNAPCVTGPCTAAPSARRRRGELREIDMDGEVGRAGLGERIGIGVAAHRLQRVAEGRTLVAVVDDERRAAACPRQSGDLSRQSKRRFRLLQDVAGAAGNGEPGLRLAEQPEGEPAIRAKPDEALAPAALGADELADRQRVEELVGDDDRRPGRRLRQPLMPGDRNGAAVERALLRLRAAPGSSRQAAPAPHRRNPGRPARRAGGPRISVPRPGPSSTSANGRGRPMSRQVSTAQRPMSSPNIWLISGAVTKSPPRRTDRASCSSRAPGAPRQSAM